MEKAFLPTVVFGGVEMKKNQHVKILGQSVVLVPYGRHHVERYHQWMQDPQLQEQTASEPLDLQQEYAMQESWLQDENKCTFILLKPTQGIEVERMIGDVNLFLNDPEDPLTVAELEVMIAEPTSRGRGIGKEAAASMMMYAIQHLNMTKFTAKIGSENETSLHLFQKSLGFQTVSFSDAFKEYTLERKVDDDFITLLKQYTPFYQVVDYEHNE